MSADAPDVAKDLAKKIWVTRGCRFAAHRRLNRRHVWSTWAVAVLSVYVIAAAIFAQFVPEAMLSQSVLNAALVVASVLVLILSLIESGRSYQLRAEHLHRCAVDLGKLEFDLSMLRSGDLAPNGDDRLADIGLRYAAILEACPDNHDKLDFETFQTEHQNDFPLGWSRRVWICITRHALTVGPYLLSMILPPAVVVALARPS